MGARPDRHSLSLEVYDQQIKLATKSTKKPVVSLIQQPPHSTSQERLRLTRTGGSDEHALKRALLLRAFFSKAAGRRDAKDSRFQLLHLSVRQMLPRPEQLGKQAFVTSPASHEA